jgi:2-iminobutanoate/2-iminopropanoate deaminase
LSGSVSSFLTTTGGVDRSADTTWRHIVQEVIKTADVLQYEQFGFTNCVLFNGVLYLSGISALDSRGQVIGNDIETQTIHTYENIESILRAAGSGLDRIIQMTSFVLNLGGKR